MPEKRLGPDLGTLEFKKMEFIPGMMQNIKQILIYFRSYDTIVLKKDYIAQSHGGFFKKQKSRTMKF